jgi:hypothetical protein
MPQVGISAGSGSAPLAALCSTLPGVACHRLLPLPKAAKQSSVRIILNASLHAAFRKRAMSSYWRFIQSAAKCGNRYAAAQENGSRKARVLQKTLCS